MDEIEVVIRIPEEWIEQFKAFKNPSTLETIILQGTILRKGHGRLIDADAINIHDVSPTYGMEVYGVTQDDIEYEPTIIEADTESEE